MRNEMGKKLVHLLLAAVVVLGLVFTLEWSVQQPVQAAGCYKLTVLVSNLDVTDTNTSGVVNRSLGVDCKPPEGNNVYWIYQGSGLRLSAVANPGYTFYRWRALGLSWMSNFNNPVTINMPARNVTVTAIYQSN